MKIVKFLKSPAGNLAVFLGFVAVGGLLLYRSNLRAKAQSEQMTKVTTVETGVPLASFTREAAPLKIPTADSSPVAGPRSIDARKKAASQPKPLPISIFSAGKSVENGTELSKVYAPYGRLIPCQTVITLESSRLDTPVIGLVTEDVWHNGRLIIPAGAEVHGRAQLDRSRERIAATGKWVIVWRDGSAMNGTELVLTGIALDREKDDDTGEFGLRDGSAGLIGDLVRTDNLEEIKLFASTFLAGVASGFQQVQTQDTVLGVAQIASGTTRNAALQGTADVLNAYAKQIQEAIERDGFFVRVPAGKQFYLYVTQTIDQGQGTRGNRNNEDIWKHEN
ncbi:MAG TPA: TrbI/VirB10 family protein [Opitutaceae bacterium]|nr:TrbI/VirB10 family protein [Opitutaceae bacterium]